MLQGMHLRILSFQTRPVLRYMTGMAKEFFECEADKYRTIVEHTQRINIYLIRWQAFEFSEGFSKN